MPDPRMNNCTRILASGKATPDVVLADGEEIVKVGGTPAEQDLPFRTREIVDLY